MNNLERMIKQRVGSNKYSKLMRVKIGKALIPCNLCFWMLPIGSAMATGIKPTTWAKGKINNFRGNGDLR